MSVGLERVQTPRLICERLALAHAAELTVLLGDPRVARTMFADGRPLTEAEIAEGLATELAQASVSAAFEHLGLEQIVAFTLPHNLASRRVMDKSGFVYEPDIIHAGLPHVLYRQRA